MKSRDIAIVGILLAIGAIVRYLSLLVPGPIVSNLVIAFYCLAVILILPTIREALGIGIVSGVICAMLSHSIFPPANMISEPIGAVVCLGVYALMRERIVISPAIATFIATLASGFSFIGVAVLAVAPTIVGKYGTAEAFLVVTAPIVLMTAAINAGVAQALYLPASRVLMRTDSRRFGLQPEDLHRRMPDAGGEDALIQLRNVSYSYPHAEGKALSNLSLAIRPGEILYVTGPTGAGKTTLCLAASGILHHEYGGTFEGTVSLFNRDVREYRSMAEIGKKIGVVFDDADAQLIFTTVEEEVASGLENQGISREEMERRLRHVAEVTGIDHLMHRAPHTLSGGQKQRVAIAATLALGTDVLLLDEPTQELDTAATGAICTVLKRLKEEGKTVVIVEQKIDELALLADRMVVIENGTIIAEGLPDHLLADERIRDLVGDGTPASVPLASPVSGSAAVSSTDGASIVSVVGLVHRYGDIPAVNGIDLEIAPGEIVAIVGENGSGKTTLVKHFIGLLRPTEGSITIDGLDTATTPITELARHVGLVFQNPDTMLFEESVEAEIAFGLKNIGCSDQPQIIDAVLQEVGLADKKATYPRSLSRGERQRLALACVIAMRPKVIILDEPTTGLDLRESRRVMDIVRRLQQEGHTIVMVTHNMRLVQAYADRIVEIAEGKIVRDIRNTEVLSCQKLCSTSKETASSTV
jgi:energy-coupling factor transporter ATP-binding protein EcfA2